jgi:hypothetical protein
LLFPRGLLTLPRQHALDDDCCGFDLNCFFGGLSRIGFSLSGFEVLQRWQKSKGDRLPFVALRMKSLSCQSRLSPQGALPASFLHYFRAFP